MLNTDYYKVYQQYLQHPPDIGIMGFLLSDFIQEETSFQYVFAANKYCPEMKAALARARALLE